MDPAASALYVGGKPVVIEEKVAGVPFDPGLGGFQLHLAFDPNTVSITILEGPFLSSTGRTTSCGITAITETNVLYNCASSGSQRRPYRSGASLRAST